SVSCRRPSRAIRRQSAPSVPWSARRLPGIILIAGIGHMPGGERPHLERLVKRDTEPRAEFLMIDKSIPDPVHGRVDVDRLDDGIGHMRNLLVAYGAMKEEMQPISCL